MRPAEPELKLLPTPSDPIIIPKMEDVAEEDAAELWCWMAAVWSPVNNPDAEK